MRIKSISVYLLGLIALSCKAQIFPAGTIPVEDHIDYINSEQLDIPDGVHIKDINNILGKYVGTWMGDFNNNTYEIEVVEVTQQSQIRNITRDRLLIRYKTTDTNGNVIENTMNLPNDSPYVIKGRYLGSNGANYILNYTGQKAECGQHGNIYINIVNNGAQMNFFLWPDDVLLNPAECPNGRADFPFPIKGGGYISLTKQ